MGATQIILLGVIIWGILVIQFMYKEKEKHRLNKERYKTRPYYFEVTEYMVSTGMIMVFMMVIMYLLI